MVCTPMNDESRTDVNHTVRTFRAVWVTCKTAENIVVKGPATGRIYVFKPLRWQLVHAADNATIRRIPGLSRRELFD